MQVMQVTVDAAKFRQLQESEQLFLVRLGQVRNDIRHIRQMVVTAHNGVKAYKGIEHELALHSLILAVRLWCAALDEAETVIRTAWHRSRLSAKVTIPQCLGARRSRARSACRILNVISVA